MFREEPYFGTKSEAREYITKKPFLISVTTNCPGQKRPLVQTAGSSSLEVFVRNGDSCRWDCISSWVLIQENPGSDGCMKKILNWMKDCDENYGFCRPRMPQDSLIVSLRFFPSQEKRFSRKWRQRRPRNNMLH